MPGIYLKLSGQPNPDLARRLAPELTALTCEILEKHPERAAVTIEFIPREFWFIHGRSLVEHDREAFRLEVTVTEDTNTRTQKERYQREAFVMLTRFIGNLHAHSNVHIIDCRANAYGYGGITQEYRFQHA